MSEFCVRPEFMLGLLTEVSRHRALADHETDILEDIIAMQTEPFRWNSRLEVQLLTASKSPGGIARFARRHGIINHDAVYQKLARLRKRQSRQRAVMLVNG
jgi:hypothetical protein